MRVAAIFMRAADIFCFFGKHIAYCQATLAHIKFMAVEQQGAIRRPTCFVFIATIGGELSMCFCGTIIDHYLHSAVDHLVIDDFIGFWAVVWRRAISTFGDSL